MTNQPVTKGSQKTGTLIAQLGGLAAGLGALFIAIAGRITWFTALILICGLAAVVVGLVKRSKNKA